MLGRTFKLRGRLYSTSQGKEIRIPVPWGHFAAKEWGSPSGKPILCLHGWQDNAGSFDPLIPLLDQRFRYIVPDAPGHGLSTPFPPGMFYTFWDLIMQTHRVSNYFGFDKFSIIGHSMGGGYGLLYASVFPDRVEKLASIDMEKPISLPLAWHTQDIGEAIEENLLAEKKMLASEPQGVPLETLVQKYVEGNFGNLSPEAARILLKRGATKAENSEGFYYSRDPRQNTASIPRFTAHEQKEILKKISCDLLILKAKDSPSYEPRKVYQEFVNLYPKYCRSFQHVVIEGKHHFHMDHPERLAPYLKDFFANH